MFYDRADAGEHLAKALAHHTPDTLVLGIPRGGVAVARVVADALGATLDVIVAHKLRAPGNPELAVGAVGPDGEAVVDERVARTIGAVDPEYLERERARQAADVERRLQLFRSGRAPLRVDGRACVIVDDGIATGSTARAAAVWLRRKGASPVVLAVPVGPPGTQERFRDVADEVIVLETPEAFMAVGQWYERFEEVTDDEVVEALGRPTV